MKRFAAAGFAGLLFGVGLAVSGMTLPSKVLGFLDVADDWDPSLAFVMAGAIGVHALLLRVIGRRRAPLFNASFSAPIAAGIERSLVLGAAIFGVGWGLAGFCPGPALVGAAAHAPSALLFVGAMAVGMLAHRFAPRLGAGAPEVAQPTVGALSDG